MQHAVCDGGTFLTTSYDVAPINVPHYAAESGKDLEMASDLNMKISGS